MMICKDGTKWYDKLAAEFILEWNDNQKKFYTNLFKKYDEHLRKNLLNETIRTKGLEGNDEGGDLPSGTV